MKHLPLLLMLCSFCFGQTKYPDYTKVTAYRLVDEYDDGPCSVASYLKNGEVGSLVMGGESYDSKFAYRLIELKQEATKKWKEKDFWCVKRGIGYETVPNMFIVEINAYRDTVFTTRDNASLFIPAKQKEYIDKDRKIAASFPQNIKDLFEKDFWEELHEPKLDSLSVDKILLGNKPLYGVKLQNFKDAFGDFDAIKTDSMLFPYNKRVDKVYYKQAATIIFRGNTEEIKKIEFHNHEYNDPLTLSINSLKAGITEEILSRKFPNSIKYKRFSCSRFSVGDLADNYFYEVRLEDRKGFVQFHISKGKVKKINIEFDYPD